MAERSHALSASHRLQALALDEEENDEMRERETNRHDWSRRNRACSPAPQETEGRGA